MNSRLFLSIGFVLLAICPCPSQSGIHISQTYPQYWSYKDSTILLLGGSSEDNLFQTDDLESELDILQSAGGNYVRNTMSSRDRGNEWPFAWDAETGKYDLDTWNDDYWQKFERFLERTSERDIIVQIEIWATFDFYRENWEHNPFNPMNNTNYTAERSSLPKHVPTHPVYTDNPFFWSVPNQNHNIPVLKYQQKFVDKILYYSLRYPNVLYCIDNETSVTSSWGQYWSWYIHARAKESDRRIFVTEMWDPHDLLHLTHLETSDHPDIYEYVDISQNNHQRGQAHWDQGLQFIKRLGKIGFLRPVNNVKTYGRDGGRHGHGTQNAIESFVRNCFMGSAAVRFHRPDTGLGITDTAIAVISTMREVVRDTRFYRAKPANDLLRDRVDNEAYCRAFPGVYYAIYFPGNGRVKLELDSTYDSVTASWWNILDKRKVNVALRREGEVLSLSPPGEGHWIVLLNY